MDANTEVAILDRLFQRGASGFGPEVARYILTVNFEPRDHARMDELAAKAQDGVLSAAEAAEVDEYRRVANFLALFHSRARVALKHAQGSP